MSDDLYSTYQRDMLPRPDSRPHSILTPTLPTLIAQQSVQFDLHYAHLAPTPFPGSDTQTKGEIIRTSTRHHLTESLPGVHTLLLRSSRGDTLHYLPTPELERLTRVVRLAQPIGLREGHGIRIVNLKRDPFDPDAHDRTLAALESALILLKGNARYVTLSSDFEGVHAIVSEHPSADPADIDRAAWEYTRMTFTAAHFCVRHAY